MEAGRIGSKIADRNVGNQQMATKYAKIILLMVLLIPKITRFIYHC